MSQKKAYTAEFKEAAVKLAMESEQSVNQTARELEVNVNTLHTWIAKYHRQQSTKGDGKVDEQHLYDELKQLRRENARLKEERELLERKFLEWLEIMEIRKLQKYKRICFTRFYDDDDDE